MLTPIGAFFLIASMICLWRKDDSLFALAIFSSIFQGASMTAGGTLGLQPYYTVVALFILQDRLTNRSGSGPVHFEGRKILFVFGSIGIMSAFTLPFVFSGLPIYEKSIGIDAGLFYRPPLVFSLSNLTQAAFLAENILFVVSAGRQVATSNLPIKAFRFAFYFLAAVAICQLASSAEGIKFPNDLILNNPGYVFQANDVGGITGRTSGTFSESSLAGAALSMFCAAFLADFVQNGAGVVRIVFAILVICVIRSTSSLAVIPIILALIVVTNPVIHGTGYIRTGRLLRITILCLSIGASLAAILLTPLGQSAITNVVEKGDTSSFADRTAADIYALDLLVTSKGLGVGLGSNRPSSIITSLLSNIGVIGFLAFIIMCLQVIRNKLDNNRWLRWAAVGLLFDMALGVPDLAFPPLWMIIALIVHVRTGFGRPSAAVADGLGGRKAIDA